MPVDTTTRPRRPGNVYATGNGSVSTAVGASLDNSRAIRAAARSAAIRRHTISTANAVGLWRRSAVAVSAASAAQLTPASTTANVVSNQVASHGDIRAAK